MNKKEKMEMDTVIIALDNLYFLVEQMDAIMAKSCEVQPETLQRITEYKEYKEKLLQNLDVIEETKDSLLGITHLKISSERLKMLFK